jgi:mono/diheme cytochrome c family protein
MRPTILAVLCLVGTPSAAHAQQPAATLSDGWRFSEGSGEALYANLCQGCHMSNGEGAVGAGRYPALARNQNLVAAYVVNVVLNGQRGMPPFGRMLSDEQVAGVVNYLRMHMGNSYRDPVTAQDVKEAR